MINFILATDSNYLIGNQGKLPWHLPEDLKYFKKMTKGKTVIMGRKTWDSLPVKPLPGRENIVVSRSGSEEHWTLGEAILYAKNTEEDVFVIGGIELFKQMIEHADRLYITWIDYMFEGDEKWPELNTELMDRWKLVHHTKGIQNEQNPYIYWFMTYERKVKR